MHLSPIPALAGGSLILLTLAGCGRAVPVTPAEMTAEVGELCKQLSVDLPEELAGERRIETMPDPDSTAAWGAPAIVWRCGTSTPTTYTTDSQLLEIDGISWYPQQLSSGNRFTAVESEPILEITVPAAYQNPAGIVADLQPVTEDQES